VIRKSSSEAVGRDAQTKKRSRPLQEGERADPKGKGEVEGWGRGEKGPDGLWKGGASPVPAKSLPCGGGKHEKKSQERFTMQFLQKSEDRRAFKEQEKKGTLYLVEKPNTRKGKPGKKPPCKRGRGGNERSAGLMLCQPIENRVHKAEKAPPPLR